MIKAFVVTTILFAVAFPPPLAATGDAGPEYPSCGSPTWSADGEWIAFASDHADGKYHIWKVRPDGTGLTQVTPSDKEDGFPAWSRDGQWIAFSREDNGNSQILVIRPDGLGETQVTSHPSINTSPAWAPDNWTLAFATRRGGGWDILTASMNPGEGEYVAALGGTPEVDPAWSPDGLWVAYAREAGGAGPCVVFNLWKARVHSTERVRLISGQYVDLNPTWHPTQNLIAFDSDRDGSRKLWLVNADGTGLRRVTSQPLWFEETEPAWSADGTKLAFVGEAAYGGEIWIVNADGTGLSQATHLTEPQP